MTKEVAQQIQELEKVVYASEIYKRLIVLAAVSNFNIISSDQPDSKKVSQDPDVAKQSFAEQIENDKTKALAALKLKDEAEKKLKELRSQPQNTAQGSDSGWLAMAFNAAGAAGAAAGTALVKAAGAGVGTAVAAAAAVTPEVVTRHFTYPIKDTDKIKSASENKLPASFYFHHGSRMLLEIPANTGDRLVNWLAYGKQDIDSSEVFSLKIPQRFAATHAVHEGPNEILVEVKGIVPGVASLGYHYGVDLAIPNGTGEPEANGAYGHLYMYYYAPTDKKKGAMLIGIEAFSPSHPGHSKFGNSDTVSAAGGALFEELISKLTQETGDFKDVKIPKKYGGMKAQITDEFLNNLQNIDLNKVDNAKLASIAPQSTIEDFITNVKPDVQENLGASGGKGDLHADSLIGIAGSLNTSTNSQDGEGKHVRRLRSRAGSLNTSTDSKTSTNSTISTDSTKSRGP